MPSFLTEPYSDALLRYKSLIGVDSLTDYEESVFRANLVDRFRQAFEKYPWPEFTVLGEPHVLGSNLIRTYAPAGAPGGPAQLTGNADTVFGIFKEDPSFTLKPSEHIFVSAYDNFSYPAVRVITQENLVGKTVYVSYRKDLKDSIKECGDPVGTSPIFGSDAGMSNALAKSISPYAIYGAYIDFLRSDGQNQKAIIEEQMADRILFQAIEKIEDHGRGHLHHRYDGRPKSQFNRHQVAPIGPVTLPGQGGRK